MQKALDFPANTVCLREEGVRCRFEKTEYEHLKDGYLYKRKIQGNFRKIGALFPLFLHWSCGFDIFSLTRNASQQLQ